MIPGSVICTAPAGNSENAVPDRGVPSPGARGGQARPAAAAASPSVGLSDCAVGSIPSGGNKTGGERDGSPGLDLRESGDDASTPVRGGCSSGEKISAAADQGREAAWRRRRGRGGRQESPGAEGSSDEQDVISSSDTSEPRGRRSKTRLASSVHTSLGERKAYPDPLS